MDQFVGLEDKGVDPRQGFNLPLRGFHLEALILSPDLDQMNKAKPLINFLQLRSVHVSAVANKAKAGRYKVTRDGSRPLTYEMSQKPHHIAHTKGWNSWNTTGLKDSIREPETTLDDMFMRKFMAGTFPELLLSEVIIKRQHNIIRIAALIEAKVIPSKIYFLIGYTEELLSYWLKCPVKLELQTVRDKEDVIYKYI